MKLRWPHWTAGSVLLMALAAGVLIYLVRAGIIDPWIERQVIQQIEQRTGTRVELGHFQVSLWRLHAELDNLTLHGLESASEPPLFHADHVSIGMHIVSLMSRKVALDQLIVTHPQVYVRYNADGQGNLPTPRTAQTQRPWQQTLFDLTIGDFELNAGAMRYNDKRVPLDVRGQNFAFRLQYDRPASGADSYVGSFAWQQVEVAAKRDAPFRLSLSTKFTLHRDSLELDELVCSLPHSQLNLRAELPSFAAANWNLHYRGSLSLEDLRTIFRQPETPGGIAEFSGDAQYSGGQWTASGYYSGHDIRMRDMWFHEGGMASSGNYTFAQNRLTVANLRASAFDGTVDGRLEMNLGDLSFKTQTHLHGADLAKVFAALDNDSFPVVPLHWDSSMDVVATNTWTANFRHFHSFGTSIWTPPDSPAPGVIPIAAQITYDYSQDKKRALLTQSEITGPHLKLDFDGTLDSLDSALEIQMRADDLGEWNAFVNAIRGPDAQPEPIGGTTVWHGRLLGPIVGPTFVGHVHSDQPRYAQYAWDWLEGDMEYSPDQLKLTNMQAKFGSSSVSGVNLTLNLDHNWGFGPSSAWNLQAQIQNAASKDVQDVIGTNYPVSGVFSGDLRGSGTRAAPVVDSDFTFNQIVAKGFAFDRLTGQLHWESGDVRLTNANLTAGPGRLTGSLSYRTADDHVEFDLAGAGIDLARIRAVQSDTLPIAGQFSFTLKGNGPIRTPAAQGELQLTGLRVGTETQGNFQGHLVSDGQNATVTLTSELARGKLDGELTAQLTDDFPVSGKFNLVGFDLDSLIVAGLHLDKLTGHSSVDGTIAVKGSLRHPETIEADADLSKISFQYELVQLTNDGEIKLSYTTNEVRVEQAHLHGTDTDLQIGGTAHFNGERPLALTLAGAANLRLLAGLIPDLETQGQATINVTVAGTMASPRITGHARVQDASATYADFPVGLSKVNGDFVFDQSRLTFDGLTAEAGGGQLRLGGSLTYGQGPMRFDVNASTTTVRIRYPAGMSWLAGGTLRLSGTTDSSLLTGSVNVQRVLLAEGVDVASFFAAASETSVAPPSSSPFLRNLSFDVAAQTTPGSRIEWSGAQIDMDGDVRLRGNWDRPVILGDVHLLGGEMAFRGNNFQLMRGDINFANPFRLDPVLNIEASTTISQYQVTIDFTGPASRLQLNYRSDPPLPDSEIVALLALGNTGESAGLMSGSSSQNYGATALLSEAISSGLGGRIEHLFGISHFSVDPFVAETSTESNAAARVTIEQQVTHDLTITYSTNAATSNQYQLIQVEYSVKRDLSVVFLRDINGTYGMDIKWVKHLK
ncbi:MAG TPA: translocation/assembly module TamB domain-containing protein [Candidatus Acidoferrum sp.]|jgi:translocation and assembly module TamB|nr:translocation/assembly module TamB domain-containing protein [Candidatus Acidoferrum sp.]